MVTGYGNVVQRFLFEPPSSVGIDHGHIDGPTNRGPALCDTLRSFENSFKDFYGLKVGIDRATHGLCADAPSRATYKKPGPREVAKQQSAKPRHFENTVIPTGI